MQFKTVQEELKAVPEELKERFQTVDALQNELRAQVKRADGNATNDQIALLDIKLQYTGDGGTTWKDATEDHFPQGGIRVILSYTELGGGMDQSHTFTVIHMFTTAMNGHTIGDMETTEHTKDASGIHFTVTSLSPHSYVDLAKGTWYHDAVDYALRNALMGGYGNGLFGPDDSVTRAQLA